VPPEQTSVLEQLLDEMEIDEPGAATIEAQLDPGVEQRVQDLIRELQHPDVRRRWRAAVALWEMGPYAAAASEALMAALVDPAPIVADAASGALARIRGQSAPRLGEARPTTGPVDVPLLVEALHHEDVRVREWAAVALRDLGPGAQEAVPALVAVLRDPGSGIRDWAALALGAVAIEVTAVLPELVHALNDGNMFLRAAAATSLGALGSRARPAVPQLVTALRDENGGVRARAAVALGRIGPLARDAVPALLRLLEDREASVADAAALALEKIIGRPEPTASFPPLPRLASDRVPADAAPPAPEPVAAGGQTASPAAPPPEAEGPSAAAGTAGEPGQEAAEPETVSLLPELVRAATAGLSSQVPPAKAPAELPTDAPAAIGGPTPVAGLPLGGAGYVRALMRGLNDRDATVRWRASVALGEIGPGAVEAVRVLVEALEDEDETVRWEAAKSLGKIGPDARDAVPALAAALSESDEVLRTAAATALGLMGSAAQGAVPALIRSLRSTGPDEPEAAVETLVKLGRDSVPALIEALNEDDPLIRSRAAAALTRVAGAS
jgi:HEAT repeat protein